MEPRTETKRGGTKRNTRLRHRAKRRRVVRAHKRDRQLSRLRGGMAVPDDARVPRTDCREKASRGRTLRGTRANDKNGPLLLFSQHIVGTQKKRPQAMGSARCLYR